MDDDELLLRCLRQDPLAWAQLRDRLSRLTPVLFAAHYDLTVHDLDDIIQETLTALLIDNCRALRAFRGESSLTTYLAAITRRVGRRWLGRQTVEVTVLPDDLPQVEKSGAETWLLAEQTLDSAALLILRLTTAGYSAQEIADIVGRIEGHPLTSEAVRQRLHRAICRLRRASLVD